jgi:hypothetical protein
MKKSLFSVLFIISLTQPLLASVYTCHPLPCHTERCQQFCYDGHPINPACIDEMVTSIRGDGPDMINLSKCEAKYRHNGFLAPGKGPDTSGWYNVDYGHGPDDGYALYKVIGRTANNTFVVSTYSYGGGEWLGSNLALFKIYEEPNGEKCLALFDSLGGGANALGGIIRGTESMKGSHVIFTQMSCKNTNELQDIYPNVKNDVDLSKIKIGHEDWGSCPYNITQPGLTQSA